jgi:putative FmdB family regulatory protein
MPTYEYLCKTCSHRFETWQKMTDEPLTTCPECGGTIRRVLYPAGIVFKGSGFYKTDHRGDSNAPTAEAKHDSSEAGASGTSESKESKPAESSTPATSNSSTTSTTGESGGSKAPANVA